MIELGLFVRILRKHDWVWRQKDRWPMFTRLEVCKRLWAAAIKASREGEVAMGTGKRIPVWRKDQKLARLSDLEPKQVDPETMAERPDRKPEREDKRADTSSRFYRRVEIDPESGEPVEVCRKPEADAGGSLVRSRECLTYCHAICTSGDCLCYCHPKKGDAARTKAERELEAAAIEAAYVLREFFGDSDRTVDRLHAALAAWKVAK